MRANMPLRTERRAASVISPTRSTRLLAAATPARHHQQTALSTQNWDSMSDVADGILSLAQLDKFGAFNE